jgi:hypothetical protein
MKYVKSQSGHGTGYFIGLIGESKKRCALMMDWVKDNFHEDIVHSVMYPEENADHLFVDVSKYDVRVELADDRPIQKTRYVVPAPKYTYDQDNNIIEHLTQQKDPYFQGMVRDGALVKLTIADMEANFHQDYIDSVKRMAMKNSRKFLRLPPGDPNPGTEIPHRLVSPDAPKVKYQQNEAATCLLSSAASALFYIGSCMDCNDEVIHEVASEIHNLAKRTDATQTFHNNWSLLRKMFQTRLGYLLPTKVNKWFDPICDRSIYPTVVQLMGKDGGVEHAVTFVGDWIFDSNFPRALPLNREALDFICAGDEDGNVQGWFLEVYHGYRFQEKEQKKRKVIIHHETT